MRSIRTLLLWAASDWRAKRRAIKWRDTSLSYEQLSDKVERAASKLVREGIQPGDIIGQMSENNIDMVVNIFAILRAGGVYCPLSPLFSVTETAYRIKHSEMKAVIADDNSRNKVTEALKESNVIIPIYSVSPLEEKHHPVHIPLISDDEPALLLYTSGSTGLPKGVLLSEKNLVTNALQVIERTNLTSEDCILHQMPLHHTNGINNNLIAPFLAGAKVVLGPRFHAETLFSLIEIERPTYFTGVPTMYWRLTQQNVPKGALDSLRFVRCGSAPLSTNLETQIEEHLGVPVITSYGLTEGTCTSTMTPLHNKLLGSVGTPLSGQEIRIVDPATMKDVGRNQEGEVMIRGNNLMLGYYKDIEATNKVFHNGWLRTGDLGKLNNQGYLFLSDRIKEIIVRGGENISPREVENVLRSHPSVIDVTVVGVPSQEYGEEPVAFIISNTNISEIELTSFSKAHLSRFKVPSRFIQVEGFPRNVLGKVERAKLVNLAVGAC